MKEMQLRLLCVIRKTCSTRMAEESMLLALGPLVRTSPAACIIIVHTISIEVGVLSE
jgi:hypothetical protein